MKKKRLLSMVLVAVMLFGSVVIPLQGAFTDSTSITVSAADDSVLGDWKYYTGKENGETVAYITEYLGNSEVVKIPNSIGTYRVGGMPRDVFKNNTTIKNVTIPGTISHIMPSTFYGCANLETVIIDYGVKKIWESAFENCTKLSSVSLPDSITIIDRMAFRDCKKLKSIVLPIYTSTIGYGAFWNCSSLESISIPDSVDSISSRAFSDCTCLKSVSFPNELSSIGEAAFFGCTSLESIDIPSVKEITWAAFEDCCNLKSAIIHSGLTGIYDHAFENCTSLTSISLPSGLSSLGERSFYKCQDLNSITIPSGVTCIQKSTFEDCINLSSVTIPNTVTSIEEYAFMNCSKLESVVIPNSVISIGYRAFNNCSILEKATLSTSMERIEKEAFSHCQNLTEIQFPNRLKSIGANAFLECSSLKRITIPDSVTEIEDGAFSQCTGLETIEIPPNLVNIGAHTFWNTKWLNTKRNNDPLVVVNGVLIDAGSSSGDIVIPNTVTKVGSCAFRNGLIDSSIYYCCVQSITVPNSVKIIEDFAFSDCPYLRKVKLNCPVAEISDGSFCWSYNLTDVNIPDSVTRIGENAFYNCQSLSTIDIPQGVETIGESAFEGCLGLNYIELPESLKTIGKCALCNTGIADIIIPRSVSEIGEYSIGYNIGVQHNKKEDFKIYCYKDSEGERYAKRNGFDYEIIYGETPQSITTTDVEFRYGNYGDPVRDYSFHYSDAMLVGKDANANNESGDIAVFSANLSVAAYEKDTILKCLKTMGFKSSNIKYAETYDFKPTYKDNDRVAYTIAYKKVNGKHLFFVPIRGTHGNCEWFSDFNLGTGKNHAGFYAAAKRVRTTLISEMKNRNADSSNTVLYFTGHSRGAAVANILAGEFSTSGFELEGYNVNVPANQIFAYTYACPAVSKALKPEDTALKNIYNYINPGDLIPALPLSEWGYKRYGDNKERTIEYSTNDDAYYDFLHRFYDFTDKQEYEGMDRETLEWAKKILKALIDDIDDESNQILFDYLSIYMMNNTPEYILPCSLDEIKETMKKKHKIAWYTPESFAKLIFDKYLIIKSDPSFTLQDLTTLVFMFIGTNAVAHGHTGETYVKWTEAYYNTRTNPGHVYSYSDTPAVVGALGYKTQKCSVCGKERVVNYMPDPITNAIKNAGKDLNLTFHRCDEDDKTYGLFKSVEVDGKTVDPSNYSTKSGSLKLTLDKSFVSKLSAGTHTVKVLFKDGFSETSIFVAENANEPTVDRLAGKGRYETATKISSKAYGFETASTVVLAYGLNYADALAGVSLAKAMNAPILLTNLKTLPNETLVEIKRLGASNVIILGGTGAVGAEVEADLKKEGLNTERIAGATRFETATKIAEKMQKLSGKAPEEVFFVYAFNSADALSVSAVAAVKGAPVIYLKTTGDLDDATAAYLKSIKGSVKNAYVIGGEGVISNDMMKKTRNALGVTPVRVFGANRFETCVAVNNSFADVLDGDMLCVATGMDFPDALAGGVYAALNKAPLFLINGKVKTPNLNNVQKAYLKAKAASSITAFGGVGVVPDNHISDIAKNSV